MSTHTHRHRVLFTDRYIWHTHDHDCPDGPLVDFNSFHHHAPAEHDRFLEEEIAMVDGHRTERP